MGKYRDWGWMNVINQTRKLIGKPDVNEELRLLEEKANAVYGEYIQAKEEKERLLGENEKIKEEKKAILKQIDRQTYRQTDRQTDRHTADTWQTYDRPMEPM